MYKRKIFDTVWKHIDSHEILLLNGARQVGKTTLLKMIKERLISKKNVPEKQILWFDLEKIDDFAIWSDQSVTLSNLPIDSKEKIYIFIDEFQKSEVIGSTLKVLHDHHPHFKIIVTGSASWYLNIDESMAGRKKVFKVWPLSFNEYLDWEKNNTLKKNYDWAQNDIAKVPDEIIKNINLALIKFLTFGGYPGVVLQKSKEGKIDLLSELINSYLLRDIRIWNYATNPLQLKKLLTLLADRIGSLLEIHSLAIDSSLNRATLENRLELLQNTFILHLLPPYFTNKTKELVKNKKIFLVDSGLRATLMQDFKLIPKTSEFGQLAENFVTTEMLKTTDIQDSLFHWRTKSKQEVDLVLKRGKSLIPIEIKAGDATQVTNGLKSFIRDYKPKEAYILNWSIIKEIEYHECTVKFRPLWLSILEKF